MHTAIDALDAMIRDGLDLVGYALQAGLTEDNPRVQRLVANVQALQDLRDTLTRMARHAAAAETN